MKVDPAVDDPRWWLSALADGEASLEECSRGLDAWADDGSVARERWHAYQLIGDVLRSDDLAHPPSLDRDFVDRLNARLDAEPPRMATAAPIVDLVAARRRPRWVVPAGLAAGVVALGTALLVLRDPGPGAGVRIAAVTPPAVDAGAASAAAVDVAQGGARVLRDAQLDRYLRAHREYGAAQPVSLPGGYGRSFETVSFER